MHVPLSTCFYEEGAETIITRTVLERNQQSKALKLIAVIDTNEMVESIAIFSVSNLLCKVLLFD
jgi:hypothetical protein